MADVSTAEDRQAGQQRLSCGCVVTPPHAREGLIVMRACEACEPLYTLYRTTVRGLSLGDTAGKVRAEHAWALVAEHVKAGRKKPRARGAKREGA